MWTPTTVGFRKEWLIRVGHAQPVQCARFCCAENEESPEIKRFPG
jgi:hypothetical protein